MNERATFRHELSRTVPGVVGQVRTALLRALSDDGFTVDVERRPLRPAHGTRRPGPRQVGRRPRSDGVRLPGADPERFGRDDIDGALDVATLLGAQQCDLRESLLQPSTRGS